MILGGTFNIIRQCSLCGAVDTIFRKKGLCKQCRAVKKKERLKNYYQANRTLKLRYGMAYYRERKSASPKEIKPEAAPMPPKTVVHWNRVEKAVKNGICARCGKSPAGKSLLCGKCLNERS